MTTHITSSKSYLIFNDFSGKTSNFQACANIYHCGKFAGLHVFPSLYFRAREAALAQQPGLETVMEEKEDETPKERAHKDVRGQTELHKLASQTGADLETLMNMGYSPADRDINNQTARDIAEENKIKENVAAIG